MYAFMRICSNFLYDVLLLTKKMYIIDEETYSKLTVNKADKIYIPILVPQVVRGRIFTLKKFRQVYHKLILSSNHETKLYSNMPILFTLFYQIFIQNALIKN